MMRIKQFVRLVSISSLSLILLSLELFSVMAQTPVYHSVGREASELGVTAYDEVREGQDELYVVFRHVDEARQGSLRVEGPDSKGEIRLTLLRDVAELTVIWNPKVGHFGLESWEGQYAHFLFDGRTWVPDSEVSDAVLQENAEDVKLTGAIYADFAATQTKFSLESRVEGECEAGLMSVPCNYSTYVRGTGWATTRSVACWEATNDANVKCWNSACIGCCDWMYHDCDCACVVDDYFCACGRNGFPCMT